MIKQYEMIELVFPGQVPEGSHVEIDLTAAVSCGDETRRIKGFYSGNGEYKVRFLPDRAGTYTYRVSGCIQAEGAVEVAPADEKHHGIVKTEGTRFVYADGTPFHPFGTTVYALISQTEELIDQTMDTLSKAPFNKVRMCVFPKDYDFNKNEPQYYPFEKDAEGGWDVHHPCFAFWDAMERRLKQLEAMQIQSDLILFHPYDRWGFNTMSQEQNLVYLDYLLRRLSAFPNMWWSLANEYDLTPKTMEEWEQIECFVADNDPYRHPLSCHNIFKFWDFTRPNITHASIQSKLFSRLNVWRRQYKKPIILDECSYEGNIPHIWGCISGKEMTARFWRACVSGAYCTHGETFLDDENEILWWSKGGTLKGNSAPRIAFLRRIIESLPGHLEGENTFYEDMIFPPEKQEEALPSFGKMGYFVKAFWRMEDDMKNFAASEMTYRGHIEDVCFLEYYDFRTCARDTLRLPEDKTYRVEVIDTWNMTREVVMENASGNVVVQLPGREYMAVLAVANPV